MQLRSSSKLVRIVALALLSTVSLVLFLISFPLPFLPPYLKVDFSEIPALIATLVFSPLAGVIVIFIKNVLYFIITGATDPVGVVANFIAGTIFILPVALLYNKYRSLASVVTGLVIGTVAMTLAMGILNYVVVLPTYALLMGWEMDATAKLVAVYAGILPFNAIKGIFIGIIFVPVFIKLEQWVRQRQVRFASS
ncbi:MAG TPA: ECF transporter S component [Pseudogracilibacillus sp.]|nr:ECF transporter S component [Pseudogracilibacillus sp.]